MRKYHYLTTHECALFTVNSQGLTTSIGTMPAGALITVSWLEDAKPVSKRVPKKHQAKRSGKLAP